MLRIEQTSEQGQVLSQHETSVRGGELSASESTGHAGDGYELAGQGRAHVLAGGASRPGTTKRHEANPNISMQGRFVRFEGDTPIVRGLGLPAGAFYARAGSFETAKGTVTIFSVMKDGEALGTLRVRPATGEARLTPVERGGDVSGPQRGGRWDVELACPPLHVD